jgi:hypothetical protein
MSVYLQLMSVQVADLLANPVILVPIDIAALVF